MMNSVKSFIRVKVFRLLNTASAVPSTKLDNSAFTFARKLFLRNRQYKIMNNMDCETVLCLGVVRRTISLQYY